VTTTLSAEAKAGATTGASNSTPISCPGPTPSITAVSAAIAFPLSAALVAALAYGFFERMKRRKVERMSAQMIKYPQVVDQMPVESIHQLESNISLMPLTVARELDSTNISELPR